MKARFFAIAALVLGLASCQQDFAPDTQPSGGEVSVQLVVSAPELIGATRAGEDGEIDDQKALDSAFGAIDYLDGNTAGDDRFDWDDVNIRYTMEVYDANDLSKPIKDRQEQITDKYEPVQFEVRLIPGRKYQFVVFADFVDQTTGEALRHQIGETLNDITLIDKSGEELNDEVADCYFKSWEFSPENNTQNQTEATLTRPYAKVRVIATDLDELNLNVHPENVTIEYDAVIPTAFNAVTGSISGDNATKTFSDKYIAEVRDNMADHVYNAGYDAKVDTETGRATHMTLFTDYILAKDEQSSIHFKMTVSDKIDAIKVVDFNTEIPIQRNYLTTIIGDVLTTNTQVDITINDNFTNGPKWNPEDDEYDVEFSFVDSAASLQEALDNYENGQVILVSDDIEGNVTVNQVEGKDYVIDGNGKKFDGTIFIDGNSNLGGAETVLIQNFNFETAKDNINFIEQNSTASDVRYPHNVTIKNCSFNATGDSVVGIRFRQGYNIVIEDCVANGTTRAAASGLHSLGQLPGCTGVTINNVNVDALEGGFNLTTSTNVTIKNSTIVARDYAVRVDASHADDRNILNIENVDFTAKYPVVARYFTEKYTINFAGDNTLTAPGYQVVLTAVKDDKTLVAPTCEYTLTGAENFVVFPGDKHYAYNQADLQSLLDNAVDGDTIELAADIEGDVTVTQKAGVKITIEGNNHNFAGVILVDGKSSTFTTAGVTIKNINFKADTISADAVIRLGNGTTATRYACNVAVEGCTFDVPGAVAVKSYTGGDKNLTIKGCTATGIHSLLQVKNIEGITIDGVNITGGRGASFGVSSNIVVKNSTFVAESYGLRAEPTSTLTIENSNIKAAEPVIVRKLTKGSYDITIDNSSVLESDNEFQIVFTNGDDGVTYEIPAGTFIINDNNNFKVYPRDIIADLPYNGETKSFDAQNALGLVALVNSVNNGENDFAGFTVTLSEDIDLQGVDFQPIGTADNKFNGTFDGQGKTISNLKISEGNEVAVFANVGENVTIKDVTFENLNVNAETFTAGLVCYAGDGLVIDNVTINGDIKSAGYAAGFAFEVYNVTIKNSVNNANIESGRAAGLIAWTDSATLENVVNNGNITGTYSAAGIANRFGGSIKNAKNYGTIVGNGTEASAGIAGTQLAATTYEYCYNYGNVTTTQDNPNSSAAGILGQTPSKTATLNYCANYGTITAEQSYAAGIGYSLYGHIVANYCYNEGAVDGADGAGAIAPKAQYGANDTANYCLNAGNITSAGKVYQGSNKNNYCYYYNNSELYNVADNTVADVTAALTVLNGGADAEFFTNENGVIVVK